MNKELEFHTFKDEICLRYGYMLLGTYFDKNYDLVVVLDYYPIAQTKEVFNVMKQYEFIGLKRVERHGVCCYLTFDFKNFELDKIEYELNQLLNSLRDHDYLISKNNIPYQKSPVRLQTIKFIIGSFLNIVWIFSSVVCRNVFLDKSQESDFVFGIFTFGILIMLNIIYAKRVKLLNEKKRFRTLINHTLVVLPYIVAVSIYSLFYNFGYSKISYVFNWRVSSFFLIDGLYMTSWIVLLLYTFFVMGILLSQRFTGTSRLNSVI